jgi:hypothetical protein
MRKEAVFVQSRYYPGFYLVVCWTYTIILEETPAYIFYAENLSSRFLQKVCTISQTT